MAVFAAALVLAANLPARAQPAACASLAPTYPRAIWETIDQPECAGWSSAGLQAVRDKLSTMATTGMIASVGGRILMQYGNVDTLTYLASVRKSVLSMLYGIYVDRGVIRLDRTLAEIGIDDVGGLTEQEKRATTRNLLMARSGIYHAASNSGDDLASAPPRGSQQPGAYYLYSNWDFNALGTIFEKETGKNIYDALEEHLARPLGFEHWDRARHEKSGNLQTSIHPAYHMHLSTKDMARIGLVMLREGSWNGTQIVPRAWVKESASALTRVHEMNPPQRRNGPWGYGYLWWVFDSPTMAEHYQGAYTGLGAVGQHILVMPKLDLVVAHKTAPGRRGQQVSHSQFVELVDLLVKAYCARQCPGVPARNGGRVLRHRRATRRVRRAVSPRHARTSHRGNR
jgi:CubicO group peptidase (beta-lactamase class C family)